MKTTVKKTQKQKQDPIAEYVEAVADRLRTGKATEHTYRPFIETLMETLDDSILAINEPKRVLCGAPDFIILKKDIPVGYLETKDLGDDLDRVEKSDQLVRYRASLGNLILTNYLEFRWYLNGELKRSAKIGDAWSKKVKLSEESFPELESLFTAFFKTEVPTIKSADDLARRLAASAQIIRKLIAEAIKVEDEDGWLNKWKNAFSQVLISNLKTEEFADMFAQTLAYGYFTALIHHSTGTEFSRFAAARILPKTNPFLRQLFAEFAGVNMPEEISWAVDELVEILKRTDRTSVLNDFKDRDGKEDAIVHFYETFLREYNPELRERRGVYYTPSPVVDYIVSSVEIILKKKFSRKEGLADEKTLILDPAVGTGSFLHSVVKSITKKFAGKEGEWDAYVSASLLGRIFGFEILMAPYAVAHLKLGLQLQDTGYKFSNKQRLGVFLTDTLEASARKSQEMLFNWVSDEANAASSIKQDKPIMVVMGNPPYSGESQNDGDWIKSLLRGYDTITDTETHSYFKCDGEKIKDRNTKWLNDDYVKFIRFGQWRIENTGHGVLAFVTNNGFLDNPTFRGMRQSLLNNFDEIYVLDLHGNTDKKEQAPDGSKDENVFDIKRGVSISFLIRKEDGSLQERAPAKVYRADLWGDRDGKYSFLRKNNIDSTKWNEVNVSSPGYLFLQQDGTVKNEFSNGWSLTDIFPVSSVGIVTARDNLCVHFDSEAAYSTMRDFAKIGVEEARKKYDLGKDVRDWKVSLAQDDLLHSALRKENVVPMLYRPFDIRHTYFTGTSKGIHCMPRGETMRHMTERKNMALVATKQTKDDWGVWATESIIGHKCFAGYDINSIFPLYLSEGDQKTFEHNEINLNETFIGEIELKTKMSYRKNRRKTSEKEFGPESVFYYILGFMYVSEYKEIYEDFLTRDFPRVFLPVDATVFKTIAGFGEKIFKGITLNIAADSAVSLAGRGDNIIEYVKYDSEQGCLHINKGQSFKGISEEAFNKVIGGFQPVERWLRDRKGRVLSHEEIKTFKKIVAAINQIESLKEEISNFVQELGGIGKAFVPKTLQAVDQVTVKRALNKVKAERNKRKSTKSKSS